MKPQRGLGVEFAGWGLPGVRGQGAFKGQLWAVCKEEVGGGCLQAEESSPCPASHSLHFSPSPALHSPAYFHLMPPVHVPLLPSSPSCPPPSCPPCHQHCVRPAAGVCGRGGAGRAGGECR